MVGYFYFYKLFIHQLKNRICSSFTSHQGNFVLTAALFVETALSVLLVEEAKSSRCGFETVGKLVHL